MIDLERMTTEYNPREDRISITAHVIGGSETRRLWLTRRLLDRLVAELVKVVRPQHKDPVYAEMMAEIAQQRAEQRHEPQDPVRTAAPDDEWLVRKIDLKLPPNGASIVFVGPQDDQQARLNLTVDVLRQWLGILRKVYKAGDWPLSGWPESLQGAPIVPQKTSVLH